ncbi:hypothetical protein [Chryseobacterium sp. SL1]|uniref:hypothetical protein n=1 Tax=Chryseobacterium sp. SL1 TaxID=2995159 RepID=UPI002274EEB1|nr:hypothetical protein [Chryseobacterium sp. SL1]MCY1660135.1 hypothetical protein [Chryseobacterium sp. SL1]
MTLLKFRTIAMVLTLSIGAFFSLSSFTGHDKNDYYGCDQYDYITIDDVMNLSPEGYEQWVEKSSLFDGTYYEASIEFSDGTRGKLFRGGKSGRYFVEDSNGVNYYYNSLRSSIRALYIYKKYGCLSSRYRL